MTVQALIVAAEQSGIVLAVEGDKLRVKAPTGTLTPELREGLATNKGAILEVLSRLAGMRGNQGKVPVPCARLSAVGGPGRCFSCGDPLEHVEAYGRCLPCGIAAELFHAAKAADSRMA